MSDDEVLEKIQYLEKNYKKYNITVDADNSVKIDNVVIRRKVKKVEGRDKTCFIINNKVYCREHSIGKELIELVHLCKMEAVPFKQKAKNWYEHNKSVLLGASAIVVLFVATDLFVIYTNKHAKNEKQQFKQEIIKEAIDSLHKEQQKTTMYNDSVKVR